MNIIRYRIGAWLWVVTGIVHTLGDALSRLFPMPAKEPVRAALRGLSFEILGMHNNYYNLTMGFSLAMGTSIAVAGVLFLFIGRLVADAAYRARPACFVGLYASVALLTLSVFVLQLIPPIVTFALASLAFAAELLSQRRVALEANTL